MCCIMPPTLIGAFSRENPSFEARMRITIAITESSFLLLVTNTTFTDGGKMKFFGVCAVVVSFFSATASAELSIEKVVGPETPGGTYKHPVSIEELPNGDLYIAYHGGEAEYDRDTAVFGARLVKGTNRWSQPKRIADTPNRGEGNAVVWQEPGGLTWLFYVSRYGETWS